MVIWRDFTYIDDILQGIYSSMMNQEGFKIYNLGNSKTVNISHLLGLIEQGLGKKAEVIKKEMQPGDVKITYADISKPKREIGYEPKTSIEEGIKRYIDWYQEIKNKE